MRSHDDLIGGCKASTDLGPEREFGSAYAAARQLWALGLLNSSLGWFLAGTAICWG